jgi:hypothetical protein
MFEIYYIKLAEEPVDTVLLNMFFMCNSKSIWIKPNAYF